MRVIAGSAKRLRLQTLEGLETRPTTDRIKETLFNMIDPWIGDCDFLDLFAGSGGIGIEALSRGAHEAVFIEKNPKAAKIIRDNLKHTGLDKRATVLQKDVFSGLASLKGKKQFDYIFMDPPYERLLEKQVLEVLKDMDLLKEEGMIIVEASLGTGFDYLTQMGYTLVKEKKYKTNKHIFAQFSGR